MEAEWPVRTSVASPPWEMMDVLTNLIVVILSQYMYIICISHWTLSVICQLCVSKADQKGRRSTVCTEIVGRQNQNGTRRMDLRAAESQEVKDNSG